MASGEAPCRIQYPPTPAGPVEGVQLSDTELEPTLVTTRFVGADGAILPMGAGVVAVTMLLGPDRTPLGLYD
jgi:hypothetical protein